MIQESEKDGVDDLLLLFIAGFLDISQVFLYAFSCDSEEIYFAIGKDDLETFKGLKL